MVQPVVILAAFARYVPRRLPGVPGGARDLVRFAASVWAGRMLITLSSNTDYLIIGRILGSSMLGYYSIAWDLLRFVPDRLFKVVGRVMLPLFSQSAGR